MKKDVLRILVVGWLAVCVCGVVIVGAAVPEEFAETDKLPEFREPVFLVGRVDEVNGDAGGVVQITVTHGAGERFDGVLEMSHPESRLMFGMLRGVFEEGNVQGEIVTEEGLVLGGFEGSTDRQWLAGKYWLADGEVEGIWSFPIDG